MFGASPDRKSEGQAKREEQDLLSHFIKTHYSLAVNGGVVYHCNCQYPESTCSSLQHHPDLDAMLVELASMNGVSIPSPMNPVVAKWMAEALALFPLFLIGWFVFLIGWFVVGFCWTNTYPDFYNLSYSAECLALSIGVYFLLWTVLARHIWHHDRPHGD